MRSTIKVKDLSLVQWDYLTSKVAVDGRDFLPGLPRACVEFELTPDFEVLHIEMDVVELAGLLTVLAGMDVRRTRRDLTAEGVVIIDVAAASQHHELISVADLPTARPQIEPEYEELLNGIRQFPSQEGPAK